MPKYETMLITSTTLDEEAAVAVVDKFKGLIEANGEIDGVEDWGKRRLAYPINKEMDGIYTLIHFTSEPDFPAELDRVYKITDGVLRSLIIAKLPGQEYVAPAPPAAEAAPAAPAEATAPAAAAAPAANVATTTDVAAAKAEQAEAGEKIAAAEQVVEMAGANEASVDAKEEATAAEAAKEEAVEAVAAEEEKEAKE